MNKLPFLFLMLFTFNTFSETKLSVDMTIDKLQFQRPPKGVGLAGVLSFKNANVNNNGIVLNINNVNNYFDSQIFVRPTFLGFTTQFGNYGFALEDGSLINSINLTEIHNSKLILDDNQLNLAGESFNFINPDASVKLHNFRLYCQSPVLSTSAEKESPAPAEDMMKNCFSFLTLNGSSVPGNEFASLEYEGTDKVSGDKSFIQTKVRSFDLRKNQINANLTNFKSASNDSYFINASEVNLNCAKDEDLKEFDAEKMKKACLNQLKLAPLKANLIDKAAKSTFNLDIKDVTVKDKIVYFTLNSGALSDTQSTTTINNLLLNCKKETDTDLLNLTQVLRDCTSFARLSIGEVKSTKPDKKDSSIKNIAINSNNNSLIIQADTKFLGLTSRVSIYGNVTLNEAKKQLTITVTDTKLPLGLNSVKLLMYFLKNNLISKDISILNNIITIYL
ncbi:MAG: hypothetical protein ACXVCE_09235 [Bacteriovorax sp.]